jgi:hypothetical protein
MFVCAVRAFGVLEVVYDVAVMSFCVGYMQYNLPKKVLITCAWCKAAAGQGQSDAVQHKSVCPRAC